MAADCPLIHQQGRFEPALKDYLTSLATQACMLRELETLPSANAFLWSHLLRKTAVFFTRNCYQSRGPKKKNKPKTKSDHMFWAADLFFLYLHVSQNAALYRNTEKRLQQTSSRTESFVFAAHIKSGHAQLCCVTYGFPEIRPSPVPQNFIIWYAQSIETLGTTKACQDLQRSAVMKRVRQQGQLTAFRNIWAVLCGPSHNAGAIGSCLLRKVYAAARHNGERLHHMGSGCKLIGCRQLPAKEALSNTGCR